MNDVDRIMETILSWLAGVALIVMLGVLCCVIYGIFTS